MSVSGAPRIDIPELARALQAADPAVLLVSSRILRRVIKNDRSLPTLGLQVPHPKTYVIDRQGLLRIADLRELEVAPGRELPHTVILIARPEPVKLAQMSAGEALVKFWRRVFHARVHVAMEQKLKKEQVTEAGIRHRLLRIGQSEFNEIRSVLLQENYLLPPRDDRSTYIEFAAVYLELRYFAGFLLPHYFPTLLRPEEIDAQLAEDVDAASLYAATRPPGAPDPDALPTNSLHDADETAGPDNLTAADTVSTPLEGAAYQKVVRQAEKAEGTGNAVRAALLLRRAAGTRREAIRAARQRTDRLAARLQEALELTAEEAAAWRRALPALLPAAARGLWPAEARLLYDLQKICLDHERGVYAIDPVEWVRSLGHRPLRRPLPAQREVVALKRLRRGLRRIGSMRVGDPQRSRLTRLLQEAVGRAEQRLRAHFRPLLTGALDRVGLVPRNLPEEVARDKVIEEMLDKVVSAGHLNMGDLRDALSHNQLKLDDLAGPREFLLGDPLLRLNKELAQTLDGVYHRGEVYLRLLQRFSSLGFGTGPGRWVTRFLALPFVGAFVLLKGTEEIVHIVSNLFSSRPGPSELAAQLATAQGLMPPLDMTAGIPQYLAAVGVVPLPVRHIHLATVETVGVLGAFFLLLINVPAFRRWVGKGFGLLGRGLRAIFLDAPAWVVRRPAVRAFLDSRPICFFRHYLLLPVLLTGVTAEVSILAGLDPTSTAVLSANFFVVAVALCASRLGRNVSETLADWGARGWRRLSLDLLPGLFRLIMEFFKRLLELVQRFQYSIDEWLRFRGGEGRVSLIVKALVSPLWRLVAYILRFAVNVLIEPQINPIKHFPVVTVSHKLVWGLAVAMTRPIADAMGWEYGYTFGVLSTIAWAIPGVFGFMAWELKENWFLYRANRPRNLRPVQIGSHGETMVRFLRRGFHSGTVPRLQSKLRKAERRGRGATARRHLAALRHVEEALRHFVERELVSLLHKSLSWGGLPLQVGEVVLASNRIRVELHCTRVPANPVWLVFDEQQGWLLAGLGESGWASELTAVQRGALAAALTGLYKMSAVDLVREQIRASLPPGVVAYDLTHESLVVWPDANYEAEVLYDLDAGPVLRPRPTVGVSSLTMPTLHADRLLFGNAPLTWDEWVAAWERDRGGAGLPEPLLPALPAPLPEPVCSN
jgi:hypothetical protein